MIQLLAKTLKWGELAGTLIILIAIIIKLMDLGEAGQLLMIGLLLLGTIYFLFGFTVPSPRPGEKQLVYTDLLMNILQKIMYIGSSVLCIAYLFAILHLKGTNEMMLIGLFTVGASLVISVVLLIGKGGRLVQLKHPIVVSISLLIFYFITPYLR